MEEYWLWLSWFFHDNRTLARSLLEAFGTPYDIFSASDECLVNCLPETENQAEIVIAAKKEWDYLKMYEKCLEKGVTFYSFDHPDYPERLRTIPDAPLGIYVKGKLPNETQKAAAIVGSRLSTQYGEQAALAIAELLSSNGVRIVSGMADGIDTCAHKGGLKGSGSTTAVLAGGADRVYPQKNYALYERTCEEGCVLSEYPPGTTPLPIRFPQRNRIISGLSDIVIVIEAKEKSGSLITADQALEQGRDVYALPGRIEDPLSKGCNRLIEQGAAIITSPEGLLETAFGIKIGKKSKMKQKNALESTEFLVYSEVRLQAQHLDELQKKTRLNTEELTKALVSLEIRGYVKQVGRGYFCRT